MFRVINQRHILLPDDVFRFGMHWREITREEAFESPGEDIVIVYRNGGDECAEWFAPDHPCVAGGGTCGAPYVRYYLHRRVAFKVVIGGAAGGVAVDRTPTNAVPRKPEAEEPTKSWIEIELLDDKGKPVAGEAYKIQLPDGSTVSGSLDANGRARVDGIDPGSCQVTFPNIHQDEWKAA